MHQLLLSDANPRRFVERTAPTKNAAALMNRAVFTRLNRPCRTGDTFDTENAKN
jgi:hypothetical protein